MFILILLTGKVFFSFPGAKVNVMYCHHFALAVIIGIGSVVTCSSQLFISNFNLFSQAISPIGAKFDRFFTFVVFNILQINDLFPFRNSTSTRPMSCTILDNMFCFCCGKSKRATTIGQHWKNIFFFSNTTRNLIESKQYINSLLDGPLQS